MSKQGQKIGEDKYSEKWSLDGETYVWVPKWVTQQVWNEAIKECEGCVPGKLPEVTLQDPYALERNIAHNSCREQTLQAISKMYDSSSNP